MEDDVLTRFYLVRHGETTWNKEFKYQGQADIPLTDFGREQAQSVAKALKDHDFDIIYSSDLSRAKETAKIINRYHNLDIALSEDIRELSFGKWEGFTYNELEKKVPEKLREWQDNPIYVRPPGGENLLDLFKRTNRFILEAVKHYPRNRILVATHAGPIRAILAQILDLKWEFFWKFKITNTSVTEFVYDGSGDLKDSKSFIVSVNNVCHL